MRKAVRLAVAALAVCLALSEPAVAAPRVSKAGNPVVRAINWLGVRLGFFIPSVNSELSPPWPTPGSQLSPPLPAPSGKLSPPLP